MTTPISTSVTCMLSSGSGWVQSVLVGFTVHPQPGTRRARRPAPPYPATPVHRGLAAPSSMRRPARRRHLSPCRPCDSAASGAGLPTLRRFAARLCPEAVSVNAPRQRHLGHPLPAVVWCAGLTPSPTVAATRPVRMGIGDAERVVAAGADAAGEYSLRVAPVGAYIRGNPVEHAAHQPVGRLRIVWCCRAVAHAGDRETQHRAAVVDVCLSTRCVVGPVRAQAAREEQDRPPIRWPRPSGQAQESGYVGIAIACRGVGVRERDRHRKAWRV